MSAWNRGPEDEGATGAAWAFGAALTVIVLSGWLSGCDIPTEYTLHTPECVLPPPSVTESASVPLGCPWQMPDGTIVGGVR